MLNFEEFLQQSRQYLGFGVNLKRWLDILNWQHSYLARKLAVSNSTISDWVNGNKRPAPENLAAIVDEIRRQKKAEISFTNMLDALSNLGYGWDDVDEMSCCLPRESRSAFRAWWAQALPDPKSVICPFPIEPGPTDYTAFDETESISDALLAWRGYQERWCRCLVLCGFPGMGKTATAIGVANDPRMKIVFREGVLWIKQDLLNQPQLLERVCNAIKVSPMPGGDWDDAWQEWIGNSERRILLVLDGVDDTESVQGAANLLKGAGPLIGCLITTRNGAKVVAGLPSSFRQNREWVVVIKGFSPENMHTFFEQRMNRPILEQEWSVLRRIGIRVGWHPAIMDLVYYEDPCRWQGILDELERGQIPFASVAENINAYYEQLDGETRGYIDRLSEWMMDPTCFGVFYPGWAWGCKTKAVTNRILSDLRLTGMIERLPSKDPIGLITELWRMNPVLQAVIDDKTGMKDYQKTWFEIKQGLAGGYIVKHGLKENPVPWQFRLWATLWCIIHIWDECFTGARLRSKFRSGLRLSEEEYDSCLYYAEIKRRREQREEGLGLPLEYIILGNVQTRIISFLAIFFILISLGLAIAGFPISWYCAISLFFWVFMQYYWAAPSLWLLYCSGVSYKGLKWIAQRARPR